MAGVKKGKRLALQLAVQLVPGVMGVQPGPTWERLRCPWVGQGRGEPGEEGAGG